MASPELTTTPSAEHLTQEPLVVVVPAVAAEPVVNVAPEPVPVAVTASIAEPAPVIAPTPAPEAAVEAAAVNPEIEQKSVVLPEPAPIPEAPVGPTEAPAVAVSTETPAETQPTPAAEVAPVDLAATLAESGLVMVQTTSAAPVMAVAEPAPKLGRPRKAKAVVASADEPLVMVETGNK
jgi:ribonuclease E